MPVGGQFRSAAILARRAPLAPAVAVSTLLLPGTASWQVAPVTHQGPAVDSVSSRGWLLDGNPQLEPGILEGSELSYTGPEVLPLGLEVARRSGIPAMSVTAFLRSPRPTSLRTPCPVQAGRRRRPI